MSSKEITIQLKTLTGKNLSYVCSKSTTIKIVKQWLEDYEGIPVHLSIFIYNGKPLDDDDTMEYYDIKNNDTITVILKMRGD